MIEKAVQALMGSESLLMELYRDVAKPGVKQVGQALGTILSVPNLLLMPLQMGSAKANIWFDRNLDKYRQEMSKVPEERVVEAAPEIAVPIIERLSYTRNEDIAELYIQLLVSASHYDFVETAHPSFISVIGRLSVDEARLIGGIRDRSTIPFVRYRLMDPDGAGFRDTSTRFTGLESRIPLLSPDNVPMYLNNLVITGILECDEGSQVLDQGVYELIDKQYRDQIEKQAADLLLSGHKVEFQKGVFNQTPYGRLFIKICTSKQPVHQANGNTNQVPLG